MTDLAHRSSPAPDVAADEVVVSRLTRAQLVARRFWRPRTAKLGAVGLALVVMLAVFGPLLTTWGHAEIDTSSFLTAPNAEHWFGTTQGGQDVFAMTVRGLQQSLIIGFSVAAIQVMLSAFVGAAAAYFGSFIERGLLWVIDLLLVIPSFLLVALASQEFAGRQGSRVALIVLLAGLGWMLSARVVRAMTASIVSLDYVQAARFMSVPSWVIITRHVLPNISSFLIVDFTIGVVRAVMAETTLSFFGFGVQAPDTSLGTLLAQGAPRATTSSWVFLAPAGVLVVLLLSVNFLGDALRDALDPSSRSGGGA